MIVRGLAGRWLCVFIIIGTLLLMFNKTAFAEEAPQSKTDPFRLGVGLGVPYGILGLNLSYRINDLIEASGGYGSARDGFKGWAIGGRIYPFSELKRFRPRLAAFYGVVGRVTVEDNATDTNRTIDVFEGFALGGGFEWKFFSRHSLDLDLFYSTGEAPEEYKTDDSHRRISLGYGYHF